MASSAVLAQRIRERIGEIYRKGTVRGDEGSEHEIGVASVDRGRGEFIAGLVRSERARATLEVGMAWGLSTQFILQALLEGSEQFPPHVVMDPFQTKVWHNAGRRALQDLGISHLVEFYEEPSEHVLPRLVQQNRQLDLAFIDGSHLFEHVFIDFRFVHLLLKPGGLVIFDDADWDSVHFTCQFAQTNWKYRAVPETEPGRSDEHDRPPDRQARPRIRAYRKPLHDPPRPEHFFVPFFEGFAPRPLAGTLRHVPGRLLRHDGHMLLRAGNLEMARIYLRASLLSNPFHLKTYLRLARTYLPKTLSRGLSGGRRLAR